MPNPNGGLDYVNCVNQNPPNSVTFSHPLLPNLIHHFFFSITVLLCLPGTLYAAGYSCPAYKKYTSCNSGYYLNGTSAGNSCDTCPAGCTCAGGTDAPVCTPTCDAGTYWNGTDCVACGHGYFCAGGEQRVACTTLMPAGSPTPNTVYSISNGNWDDLEHAQSASDCICDWILDDDRRKYFLYQGACAAGPSGITYTQYDACRDGYYAINPLGWGAWYSDCAPCTNGPENSIYTSYSTPSQLYAVESNCPWECDAGYSLVNGNTCAQICTAGITQLHLGTGVTIPLFATKHTEHALHVGYNNAVCFGNLSNGAAADTLNININGNTYHLIK